MTTPRPYILPFGVLVCLHAGCGFHVGRPPLSGGYAVGGVVAPVPEPELPDALTSALAAAIRRRGAAGSDPISATVVAADLAPSAGSSGEIASWNATLRVRFESRGRAWEEQRTLPFAAASTDPAAVAAARAGAFRRLAGILAEDAVAWFLFAPEAP